MQAFKDATGQTWDLEITLGTTYRVKRETGISIAGLFADGMKGLQELEDPEKFGDFLYALVRPQAEQRNLTKEYFLDRFAGDSFDGVLTALERALTDFFRDAQTRANMAKVFDLARRTRTMANERLSKALETMTPESLMGDQSTNRLMSSSGEPQAVSG